MKTCLVVDDSRVARAAARHMLEAMDFAVVEAVDGHEALDRLREGAPDALLLDWHMPGMSGADVLRAMGEGRRARVVVCSADHEVVATGADGHLFKPFDRQALASTILGAGAGGALRERATEGP